MGSSMTIEQFLIQYHPGLSQYCTAVIDRDGDIEACQVSHLKTMIEMYGDPDILSKIPEGNSPLFWLVNHLHCVLVDYENQLYSGELTGAQQQALEALAMHGLICENRKNIHGHN